MANNDNDYLNNAFPAMSIQPPSNEVKRKRSESDSADLRLRRSLQSDSDSDSDASGVIVQLVDKIEEKINGQWEYEAFDDENWAGIVEEPTDDPDYCFLCACKQTEKELEGNPELNSFTKHLVENYALMTRMKLSMQGQFIYNKVIRPHTAHKKPMRCKTIIDHLEKHAPTLRIQLEHQNRTTHHCLLDLAQQIRQREKGSKRTRLDKQNTNLYVKLAIFSNSLGTQLTKFRPDASKK